jgi:hypothetical protein
LARVLSSRGHACQVIALADRFVDQASEARDADHGFQIVRLPMTDWRIGNINFVVDQLARFQPDWASLQMVCYGYERQGLLWGSARRFARLGLAPHRHMMFHELWIGGWRTSSLKERAVGWAQQRLLLRATRTWAPQLVHTSNPIYREMLRRVGVAAEELAIPSNIPVRELSPAGAREKLERSLPERPGTGSRRLLGGVFGHLPTELAAGDWLEQLAGACARIARELVIVQLGRSGPGGGGLISALRQRMAGRVKFLELGELPASEVSTTLQGLDFGIATTLWPLVGKSSTAAAMLEHGLPVVVPRQSEGLRGGAEPASPPHPQLIRLSEFCDVLQSATLPRLKPKAQMEVYDRFIGTLERAL